MINIFITVSPMTVKHRIIDPTILCKIEMDVEQDLGSNSIPPVMIIYEISVSFV